MNDVNATYSDTDAIIANNNAKIGPTLNDMISSENNIQSLDDMIIINEENTNEVIELKQSSDSDKDTLPKVNTKMNETDPLHMNILGNKEEKQISSTVVNIPQSKKSGSQKMGYVSRFSETKNTLKESILTTIGRDLYLIYIKIKYVVNPFISRKQKNNQIRQWDLWGPLLLDLLLAFTLSFNTKEKSQLTTLIFVIFWLGGVILYLNANFLGVKTSVFQILCLLGYCLFPLNLSAIIVTIFNLNDIFRIIIVMMTFIWSVYSSIDYLKIISNNEQRYLVLYPCILFYLYISWFIFISTS